MNILIVDDNKNNRMILQLLLEDYMEDNEVEGIEFLIDEASDGLEAIRKTDEKEYDIVLMDIMMPNMDGIEATKRIRQKHKKLLIIAVSAVDDAARQKEILSNGAEDYISKPVNSDIFNSRMANYLTLIHSRHTKKSLKIESTHVVNIFTNDIYSRYTNFILSSEDALSELWEYYLLDLEDKCENLSDVIRMVFSIAEIQLKLEMDSNLFVEESESFKYFTVTNISDVPAAILQLLLKKNEIKCEYKIENDKISFKLAKQLKNFTALESFISPVKDSPVSVEPKETTSSFEASSLSLDYASTELEVFDYIESYDMEDMEEYAKRLSSLMLIVGSGDVSEDEVVEIYTYIEKIGAILAGYSEVYPIATALSTLASDMATHTVEFIENSEALGPMCAAFSKDLSNWIEQSFYTGAPSIDFMNDTIVVNCQTIGGMLKMDEAPEGDDDFDDIFDF